LYRIVFLNGNTKRAPGAASKLFFPRLDVLVLFPISQRISESGIKSVFREIILLRNARLWWERGSELALVRRKYTTNRIALFS